MDEMTEKCAKEIESIKVAVAEIQFQIDGLNKKRDGEIDWRYRDIWQKDINRRIATMYKKEEKIRELEGTGFSTREQASIKQEIKMPHFITIQSEKSLGSMDRTTIGISKVTGGPIEVKSTRYSGFMSNVRGCGSLANTTEINSIKRLTDQEYEAKRTGDRIREVAFCGYEKTIIHPDGSIEKTNQA